MTFTVLIPARLASTRLPNKPLAPIDGVPMVVRVAQRVIPKAGDSTVRVVVAADDVSITDACSAYGVASVLTRTDHASGSDRLAEACDLLGLDDDHVVVNVQGDEPLIDPRLVDAVARLLHEQTGVNMSTAAHPIATLEEFRNPNIVKVVTDGQHNALYFSRAPIPMARDHADDAWWTQPATPANALLRQAAPMRHIGIYGYRAGFLRKFPKLAPAPLERAEALEQLRALWHGYRIAVHVTANDPGAGVDTPQDLERVRQLFRK
ncbi:MAG: 3-deoxy-manno-octulosonate cytidylyltransferase [Rhodoferax sp.]|jgi:3-deoxy-manno-octulosonate cytidylyltransferase (CMP-KDO synthetase)|nr:3-deoxy-manno-octulosonate cytidylyltransferase [Rhodoferax sp.]